MEDINNPYLVSLEATINRATAAAIKPYRDQLRRFHLILGFASQALSDQTGRNRNEITDQFHIMASHALDIFPDEVSMDGLEIAGAEIYREEVERMKDEVYQGGSKPSEEELQYLGEIFVNFSESLTKWFTANLTPEFIAANEDTIALPEFNALKHDDNALLSLAWNSRISVNRALSVDFNYGEHKKRWGGFGK